MLLALLWGPTSQQILPKAGSDKPTTAPGRAARAAPAECLSSYNIGYSSQKNQLTLTEMNLYKQEKRFLACKNTEKHLNCYALTAYRNPGA